MITDQASDGTRVRGADGLALFETALGRCGICWSDRGIAGLQLPGRDDARTRDRLLRIRPTARPLAAPARVRAAIDGIVGLLDGERADLAAVELDLRGVGSFDRRVYTAAREIGPGATRTYGEIAARIGAPAEAREVGRSLARNRFPIVVPCHRVVAASGRLGGFSAPGGTETKRRLLAIEAAHAREPMTLFEASA